MQHHDEAAARFAARARDRPGVHAVLLTGSVATGRERPDSDVDLVVVVDDEHWDAALAAGRIMYTETDDVGYEHGYFDVKLASPRILRAACERGDDPARDSLATAKVLFSRGFDAAGVIALVGSRSDSDWLEMTHSFLAQARLHGGYFLPQGLRQGDPLLIAHAAVHLALASARAVLASRHIRYPGPKHLSATLRALPDAPEGFTECLEAVVSHPSVTAAEAMLRVLERATGDAPADAEALSRFVLDNELAWYTGAPAPEFR